MSEDGEKKDNQIRIDSEENSTNELRLKRELYSGHRAQTSALFSNLRHSPYQRKDKMPKSISPEGEWPSIPISDAQIQTLSKTFSNSSPQITDQEMADSEPCSSKDNFQYPSKTSKPRQIQQKPTPITNKYGILINTPEREETTVVTPKKNWVPPIIINKEITDYKKFVDQLTTLLGHSNFSISLTKRNVKLILRTDNDHAKACNDLKAEQIAFHTYPKAADRVKKIVLKAAPHMDNQDLKDSLKEQNIIPTEIIPLKGKNVSHSYLVTLPKQYQINDVRKVENIDN